jgi:hypothetical protein
LARCFPIYPSRLATVVVPLEGEAKVKRFEKERRDEL